MSAGGRILLRIVGIGAVVLGIGAWVIRGPGPLDFAGGPTVALRRLPIDRKLIAGKKA